MTLMPAQGAFIRQHLTSGRLPDYLVAYFYGS
jgi:hypothetical protein